MKNFILFLFIIIFNISYAQDEIDEPFEYEIFYMVTEYRDNINQDFPEQNFRETVGIFSFEHGVAVSLISVKGDFTEWKSRYWQVIGQIKKYSTGPFSQLIFPVIDLTTQKIGVVSFTVGPFEFPEEIFAANKDTKFEATILHEKIRYTFIGIFIN